MDCKNPKACEARHKRGLVCFCNLPAPKAQQDTLYPTYAHAAAALAVSGGIGKIRVSNPTGSLTGGHGFYIMRPVVPEPRYDDVFRDGTAALDADG